jgi:hypothetical protein
MSALSAAVGRLNLASRGALAEVAHRLLVDGDPVPLLRFGATSGKGIAFGLTLFGVNATRRRPKSGLSDSTNSNSSSVPPCPRRSTLGPRIAPSGKSSSSSWQRRAS